LARRADLDGRVSALRNHWNESITMKTRQMREPGTEQPITIAAHPPMVYIPRADVHESLSLCSHSHDA
jgi:hypothetical protein